MTKMSAVELIVEQVVMGNYKNGEDKILYKTLPKSMIDHAFKVQEQQAHEYAWYVIKCIDEKLPQILFSDWLKQNL